MRIETVGIVGAGTMGGGIAINLAQHGFHAVQDPGGQFRQRLVRLHHVQIVIGGDFKARQHGVEHAAMLRGNADARCELIGSAAQMQDERAELDGFRPRAEYDQNFGGMHEDQPEDSVLAQASGVTRRRAEGRVTRATCDDM